MRRGLETELRDCSVPYQSEGLGVSPHGQRRLRPGTVLYYAWLWLLQGMTESKMEAQSLDHSKGLHSVCGQHHHIPKVLYCYWETRRGQGTESTKGKECSRKQAPEKVEVDLEWTLPGSLQE